MPEISINRGTTKHTRIYVWHKKESLLDNLTNRRNRPHEAYGEIVIPELIKKGFMDANTPFVWNQYAGCKQCPCSPGFVLEAKLGYDIHVTI